MFNVSMIRAAGMLMSEGWLTRGLATLPMVQPEPFVAKDKDVGTQADVLVVRCFCVCRGSACSGLLGVSSSVEREISQLSASLFYSSQHWRCLPDTHRQPLSPVLSDLRLLLSVFSVLQRYGTLIVFCGWLCCCLFWRIVLLV